jgi:hypothetical protein
MITHAKKFVSILPALALITLAVGCGTPSGGADTHPVETIVAATMQALTETAGASDGASRISYGNVSFRLPPEVADTALAGVIPGTIDEEGYPWWEIGPEHLKFVLDRYRGPAGFLEPEIVIYPAAAYAASHEHVAENIQILTSIAANGAGPDTSLPSVPFFNAAEVFASQINALQFQNGSGVRAVTEYAQYAASINNEDLFYVFQGLSRDGAYYVIAIFPIRAPILAETSDPEAFLPEGGVAFPGYEDATALDRYYADVTQGLNALPADRFQPSLAELDALIQSLMIGLD